jgi:hypothetical protein
MDAFVAAFLALLGGRGSGASSQPAPLRVLQIPGGCDRAALHDAAEQAASNPTIGIVAEQDVPWPEYAALPEHLWDPLADAARLGRRYSSITASPTPLRP